MWTYHTCSCEPIISVHVWWPVRSTFGCLNYRLLSHQKESGVGVETSMYVTVLKLHFQRLLDRKWPSVRTDGQLQTYKATITSGLCLGRSEVFRSLGHCLRALCAQLVLSPAYYRLNVSFIKSGTDDPHRAPRMSHHGSLVRETVVNGLYLVRMRWGYWFWSCFKGNIGEILERQDGGHPDH